MAERRLHDCPRVFLDRPLCVVPSVLRWRDGRRPWGALDGVSNALAAVNVPAGPFASGTLPQALPNTASTGSATVASVAAAQTDSATCVSATFATSRPSTPASAVGLRRFQRGFEFAVSLGLLCWRHHQRQPLQHRRIQSTQLFAAANTTTNVSAAVQSSVALDSRQTSLATSEASIWCAEMVWLQSQCAMSYTFPPVPGLQPDVYQQPLPPAEAAAPGPGMIPPTKLEREHMIWQQNANAATAVRRLSAVPTTHSNSTLSVPTTYYSRASSVPSEMDAAYGGLEPAADADADGPSPLPGYYAH
ncbi:hypothetical protein DFH09DRAFT_1464860 [Mycena vulgaris]|nr:hypothetical protein DFH09DRAFT_1464860 [Mycena vulgaris]